jgi:hypothetical protein
MFLPKIVKKSQKVVIITSTPGHPASLQDDSGVHPERRRELHLQNLRRGRAVQDALVSTQVQGKLPTCIPLFLTSVTRLGEF